MKNIDLHCLRKQSGTRDINKSWLHIRCVTEFSDLNRTRTGRRKLRAIAHQQKLRHKSRIATVKRENEQDTLERNVRKEVRKVRRLLNN
jgi:hypothetical protein